jgi:hypothetical protein
MPATKYVYQKEMDISSLVIQIQASPIVTVLDHIDVTGNETDVWFKDVLSANDQTTLNTVVTNYTYITPPANPPTKVIQVLGQDSFSIWSQGVKFTATAGQATIYDFKLTQTVYARGGALCSFNVAAGDWITVDVIDKDNVTGQGGTPDNPTMLDDYIPTWYVMPGQNLIEDISLSSPLPSGLYFRFTYHSVGVTDTIVVSNLLTYVTL